MKEERIKEIIFLIIQKDEQPGDQVGGSGHLSEVSFELISYEVREISDQNRAVMEVAYTYKVFVVSEFSIEPFNPPHEFSYQKCVFLDARGEVVGEGKKCAL